MTSSLHRPLLHGLALLALLIGTAHVAQGRTVGPPQDADAHAHDEDEHDDEAADEEPDEDAWRDDLVVTHHSVTIGGVEVDYTATAGTLTLAEEDGEEKADVFFMAYTRDGVADTGARPLTFSFNGGPGSSSVWLHLGVFGPKRVPMPDDASTAPPPYRLMPNEHSLLDLTDLVFIDPVTTGYSRAADGEDDRQFHGVTEDIEAVAEFIRLYTTRFVRWNSPKFLAGESYGTTRAAGLAGHLQGEHGMFLNGLVLVSSILNFQTARFDPGNDLPYPLFLPTYTATAWYHGRLAPDLQADLRETLSEVETFARGEYTHALAKGSLLTDVERRRIADQLARYTGTSVDWVERTNLRIKIHEFCKELRRDERLTVGRLDSRYVGYDSDAAGDRIESDPSYAAIQGPYTATLNHYVRSELGYESDLPYEILTSRVWPWNFGSRNGYVNVGETLRQAMSRNTHLKVFVANGYYDLATPYFATEYTFEHLGLEPALQDNVSMGYYESGHMMYIHGPSLVELRGDLVEFYAEAAGL